MRLFYAKRIRGVILLKWVYVLHSAQANLQFFFLKMTHSTKTTIPWKKGKQNEKNKQLRGKGKFILDANVSLLKVSM